MNSFNIRQNAIQRKLKERLFEKGRMEKIIMKLDRMNEFQTLSMNCMTAIFKLNEQNQIASSSFLLFSLDPILHIHGL